MSTLRKDDVVKRIREEADVGGNEANLAYKAVMDSIVSALQDGAVVNLAGVGTLAPAKRGARVCRNPQTGEAINVPERMTVKFRLSAALKRLLNGE